MFRSHFIHGVAAAVVGIATCSAARAGDYAGSYYGYYPGNYGYGAGIHVPGTALGGTYFGVGAGLGSYYSGLGDYNYKTGLGLVQREAAREHYLRNRTFAVQTYFERRRVNEEYRAANRPTRLSSSQVAAIARQGLPDRSSIYDVDPVTGQIRWPAALEDARFDTLRAKLERLFAERLESSAGVGSANHREIVEATNQLQAALRDATFKSKTDPLDAAGYLPARKFLDSLAYEARFEPGAPREQVAAR